ncbi:hypothetical protein E2320_001448, partial [Naja naja]
MRLTDPLHLHSVCGQFCVSSFKKVSKGGGPGSPKDAICVSAARVASETLCGNLVVGMGRDTEGRRGGAKENFPKKLKLGDGWPKENRCLLFFSPSFFFFNLCNVSAFRAPSFPLIKKIKMSSCMRGNDSCFF